MTKAPICPRCQGELSEPNVWHSGWRCARHGTVQPLRPAHSPTAEGLHALLTQAAVPVWLPWPDPGEGFAAGPPHALVQFGHHEFPLWSVEAPGAAVFAGEVLASWLWIILWPDTAGTLMLEPLPLRDLRDPGQEMDVPFGALSPRLPG